MQRLHTCIPTCLRTCTSTITAHVRLSGPVCCVYLRTCFHVCCTCARVYLCSSVHVFITAVFPLSQQNTNVVMTNDCGMVPGNQMRIDRPRSESKPAFKKKCVPSLGAQVASFGARFTSIGRRCWRARGSRTHRRLVTDLVISPATARATVWRKCAFAWRA